jgi:hypothetical protein
MLVRQSGMLVEERANDSAALENVDLLSLVEHGEFVQATETTENVYKWFQSHHHEYVGVVSNQRLIGVVSRGHIGFLLGARFGFALYGQQTVDQHLMKGYLRIYRGASHGP